MSETAIPTPAETPAPVAEPVAAPEVPPAVAVAEAPAPVATPEAAPAAEVPATETPAEPEKPAAFAHTDTATLLEEIGKEGTEAAPTAPAPVEVPTSYDLKLPDGLTVDEGRMAAYTELLGQHHVAAEVAQPLLDMHVGAMTQYADYLREEQHRVFAETRRNWRDQVKGDEELGGSGFETSLKAVARMRDLLVPEPRRAAFDDMLRVTGVGDHPEFLRLFQAAARIFDEPPAPTSAPRPSPGAMPTPGRRGVMYDHPSSRKVAGR